MRFRDTFLLAVAGSGALIALPWILTAILEKPLPDGAREQFSKEFSCPEERVQVRARPDVRPFDVFHGERPAPPDEVARDPARLAIWEKQQREREESWNGEYRVFEARGCDHEVVYDCAHAGGPEGETYPGLVSCITGRSPPGTVRPW